MENQLSHLISNFTIKIKTAVHVHTYNSTITKRKENIFPSNHTYSHRHVITMNKRSGIHCRSVCGKCEQILGQSWSLRCQHDCLHGGVPFLVCLKVTLYRDL